MCASDAKVESQKMTAKDSLTLELLLILLALKSHAFGKCFLQMHIWVIGSWEPECGAFNVAEEDKSPNEAKYTEAISTKLIKTC
jgi:hypothetical protein